MELKLTFQAQVNANRTYFYPICDGSIQLLALMKRKALVPKDRPLLEEFIKSIGHAPKIQILPPETPEF